MGKSQNIYAVAMTDTKGKLHVYPEEMVSSKASPIQNYLKEKDTDPEGLEGCTLGYVKLVPSGAFQKVKKIKEYAE